MDYKKYRSILKRVSKPARYTGGERNQIIKDKSDVKCRWAFCFPDTYEVGMSNLGVRLLYGSLNECPDVWCERVYAPWGDMADMMKKYSIPLMVHESGDPISEFDIVAFTLQYEMCYTNVLMMLELAEIPLLSSERGEDAPIIIGGGPCSYNAEPMADFFDIFSIGEGEEALPELASLYIKMKSDGSYTKAAFLYAAATELVGFYVPSLYSVDYNEDGTVRSISPRDEKVPSRVEKRIIHDFDTSYFSTSPVMPYTEVIQDRIMLEVFRGCIRGCRFCQAGMIYRPVRDRGVDTLCRQAAEMYKNTGYDEISLTSLAIDDYTNVDELTDALIKWTDESKISLSLPSLRADSFTEELMRKISGVRSSGLTFAPEAGTQRLRDAINKNVYEKDILNAVHIAFAAGKSQVKLYFMIGLPTETDEDIIGIAELAKKIIDEYYKTEGRNKKRPPQVTLSTACFIPKPFTPFQWEAQVSREEFMRRQRLLSENIRDRRIIYHFHDSDVSFIEAVLARGDRRLSRTLLEVHKMGARFDAWDECFDYDMWRSAFEAAGIDPSFYTARERDSGEALPWDVIDCGVDKRYLEREREKSKRSEPSRNCREGCSACGANKYGGKILCPKLKAR
ncbi:MAG: TIGR03960 family B12-binding radical SAM protein [Firmicutes bacterium]|nr:TIGR03960 family B12-binding radical SAM protein [Bacillota bacterium]